MYHAGAVFIQIIQSQLDKFGEMKFESLSGASARKIVLVIGIMSAHALGEGCGVGVSFCGTRGWAQVISAYPISSIPYQQCVSWIAGLIFGTILVPLAVSSVDIAFDLHNHVSHQQHVVASCATQPDHPAV